MKMTSFKTQQGNVLFLILLAVALFAALSYAVTQSSRSGGSDAGSETDAVNAASITQYPTGVRTAILRLTVDGTQVQSIEFNDPSAFGSCSSSGALCVFHPSGGGASHQQAPAGAMADGDPGDWTYNMEFEIPNIGTTTGNSLAGNELIAFLEGITYSMCVELNKRYDVNGGNDHAPVLFGSDAAATVQVNRDNATAPTGNDVDFPGGLSGEPYGCFEDTNSASATQEGNYIYYHTLVER